MAENVCPIWVGHLLASPLRRLLQDPRKILTPHLREGVVALDVGCAMGFFSLPMAVLVGPSGRVVCTDLQEGMLEALERRARKAGVVERLEIRRCSPDTLDLGGWAGRVDFALAFAVVHEVPDRARLFSEIHAALKSGGSLLLAEPRGHVQAPDFERTLAAAAAAGLTLVAAPEIRRSRTALLCKPPTTGQSRVRDARVPAGDAPAASGSAQDGRLELPGRRPAPPPD